MRKPIPQPSKPAGQYKRFIETARALDCDENKEQFEEKLGKIAKAKPAAKPKSPKE
jgi:hypothetical protein